jgi:predicted Zn-dependent protease
VHRIAAGEDVAALAEAMPVEAPRETFELLNGLRPGRVLRVGDEVKLVGE